MTANSPIWKTQPERLEMLKQHFLQELVEDPIDGSEFDMDVLQTLESLQTRWK